jgi:outer membrane lipoprotein-sorting protein
MADAVYKDIRLLKGLTVDQFLDTMGFFSASTNMNCIDCHGLPAAGDQKHYADETKLKTKARMMIGMMQAINRQNFGGKSVVTCYTCHRGAEDPKSTPSLAVQYSEPLYDPDEIEITTPADEAPSPDQIFDKYMQALGGVQRLAAVTSMIAKGNYVGFDTETEKRTVDVYLKAPDLRSTVVHYRAGDGVTVYDGTSAWISQPDKPIPFVELTEGQLEGAKIDATAFFPAGLRKLRSAWKIGMTTIEGRDVWAAVGTGPQPPVKLFFDKGTGLLVRLSRYIQLPIGRVPTHIDFDDYREVAGAGVKMPFKWVATWVDGQSTTTLTDVRANAPIDAGTFARPLAAKR